MRPQRAGNHLVPKPATYPCASGNGRTRPPSRRTRLIDRRSSGRFARPRVPLPERPFDQLPNGPLPSKSTMTISSPLLATTCLAVRCHRRLIDSVVSVRTLCGAGAVRRLPVQTIDRGHCRVRRTRREPSVRRPAGGCPRRDRMSHASAFDDQAQHPDLGVLVAHFQRHPAAVASNRARKNPRGGTPSPSTLPTDRPRRVPWCCWQELGRRSAFRCARQRS